MIVADEPVSALDASIRAQVLEQVRRTQYEDGVSFLFITHDLVEAITLSDQIVVMTRRPGRVKEIYDVPLGRPRNVFEIYLEPGFDAAYATLWKHFKSEMNGGA